MKKKLIIIGTSLILSMGVFVGCGSSSTINNTVKPVDTENYTQIDFENYDVLSVDRLNKFDKIVTVRHKKTGKLLVIYKGYNYGNMVLLD